MCQLQPSNSTRSSQSAAACGFTLIEVLVAMAVLAIGLLSIAALIGGTLEAGTRARYMSMASILASEKLDSLNKYPSGEVTVTTATTQYETATAQGQDPTDGNLWPGGSLNGSQTCAANDQYCDEVTVSESSGADYETQTQMVMNPGSNPPTFSPVTSTIVHTNTGCVGTPTACGVPGPSGGGSTFTRRWLITADPTITSLAGASVTASETRRITVVVTMNTNVFSTPVSFQLSMVRP
jgi:type IV pilus modification protein PilV